MKESTYLISIESNGSDGCNDTEKQFKLGQLNAILLQLLDKEKLGKFSPHTCIFNVFTFPFSLFSGMNNNVALLLLPFI